MNNGQIEDALFISIDDQDAKILQGLGVDHVSADDEELIKKVQGRSVIVLPIKGDTPSAQKLKFISDSLRSNCPQIAILPFIKHAGVSYTSLHALADAVDDGESTKLILETILLGDDTQSLIDLLKETAKGPRSINAADLQRMVFSDPRWAILNLIPEGLSILAGRPKCGKSIMAMNIALAIAEGGAFFGQDVEQGVVIYLALEDTPRRLQTRINRMLANSTAPKDLILFTEWPRMDKGGLQLLEETIKKYSNVRLAIIDTLAKIKPRSKGNNANVYDDDYAYTADIKGVADRCTVPIVAIHHQRKMSSDDVFDTVSGSHGLTGAADGILILERKANPPLLHVTGRDIEQGEYALNFDPTMLTWNFLGKAQDIKSTIEKQKLYDALRDTAGEIMTPAKLVKITGLKAGYVRKTLMSFINEGVIQHKGYGEYIFIGNTGNSGNSGYTGNTGNTSELFPDDIGREHFREHFKASAGKGLQASVPSVASVPYIPGDQALSEAEIERRAIQTEANLYQGGLYD